MENVSSDLIRGNIDTIVLRCLHLGDMYGLEICNLIKDASSGTYLLKQPTLYSCLKRLEKQKLISSYWQDSAIGGRRHYYKLTDTGRNSFAERKDSWQGAKGVIDNLIIEAKQMDKTSTDISVPNETAPSRDTATADTFAYDTHELGAFFRSMNYGSIAPYNPYEKSEEYIDLGLGVQAELITETPANEITPYMLGEAGEAPQNTVAEEIDTTAAGDTAVIIATDTNTAIENEPLIETVFSESIIADIIEEPAAIAAPSPAFHVQSTVETLGGQDFTFAKYLSPHDKATLAMNAERKQKQQQLDERPSEILEINFRPFVKHNADKRIGEYVFINRMQAVAALLAACVIISLLVIAGLNLKTDYTYTDRVFFTVGYIIAGLYFLTCTSLWLINPKVKRAVKNKRALKSLLIRIGVIAAAMVAVLSINVLAGLSTYNLGDFLVTITVPAIIMAMLIVDSIIMNILNHTKVFTV